MADRRRSTHGGALINGHDEDHLLTSKAVMRMNVPQGKFQSPALPRDHVMSSTYNTLISTPSAGFLPYGGYNLGFLNAVPCSGFVKKSATCSSVKLWKVRDTRVISVGYFSKCFCGGFITIGLSYLIN
jgi:hypothetical protein